MQTEQNIVAAPEQRRVSRYALPALEITIGGDRFRAINWSMGGALLHGVCDGVGMRVRGAMGLAGSIEGLPFAATVVRADRDTGTSALCFEDCRTDRIEFPAAVLDAPLQ